MKKNLVVLSGAGMSAESGISTFRDAGGLWEQYPVEQVATPEGFARNPGLVLDFYNARRRQLLEVGPNEGHRGVAALEQDFNVTVVTQNVDNLHERAGSTHVIHLHGELDKVCSSRDPYDPRYIRRLRPEGASEQSAKKSSRRVFVVAVWGPMCYFINVCLSQQRGFVCEKPGFRMWRGASPRARYLLFP